MCKGCSLQLLGGHLAKMQLLDADGRSVTRQGVSQHSNETLEFAHFLLKLVNGSLPSNAEHGTAAIPKQHGYDVAETLALVLSALGMLANISVLLGLLQLDKKLSPNLRLVLSLCFSDILICLCVMLESLPLTSRNSICVTMTLRAMRMTSHIISLLNLFGLALDHYTAVVRPLLYPLVMNPKRASVLIVIFWVLAFLCGFSDFYVPLAYYTYCKPAATRCLPTHCSPYDSEYLMFAVTLLLFLVMACIYIQVFRVIWSHRKFQARYRRVTTGKKHGLLTTLLILGTFMVCWLPYCFFDSITIIGAVKDLNTIDKHMPVIMRIDKHLYNLLLLNCLCDPIIYATRMKDVRNGYYQLLNRVFMVLRNMGLPVGHHQVPLSVGAYQTSSIRCSSMGQILVNAEQMQAHTTLWIYLNIETALCWFLDRDTTLCWFLDRETTVLIPGQRNHVVLILLTQKPH